MSIITVGIIAAPELPAKMAVKYVETLPDLFRNKVDKDTEWEIETVVDPLIGSAEQVDEMLDKAYDLRKKNGWHYAVCLTDLPVFNDEYIVAADISTKLKVAQISIPAFGWIPLRRRVGKAIIQVMRELYNGFETGADVQQTRTENHHSDNLLRRQFPITRIKQIKPTDAFKDVETRYVAIPKLNGEIRLSLGMAQANRPWSIMPSFKKIIAIAFSTGAFGLIFTTFWDLSHILSTLRLSALTIAAISLMIVWIIIDHRLWERPFDRGGKRLRNLYNRATLLTLILSVMTYYVVLYLLFFVAVGTLVPPDVFASEIDIDGNVSFLQYLRLAWLATSISTIAGAIGASLENDKLIKDIMYGYRQKRRYNEIQENNSQQNVGDK